MEVWNFMICLSGEVLFLFFVVVRIDVTSTLKGAGFRKSSLWLVIK